MTRACRIEMLAEPMEATLEDIESGPLDVFFTLGIVNPFGPTLSFVGALGKSTAGAVLPLVNVMLNPFSQRVEQVGWFTVGDQWTPEADFEPLINLGFGACPTLLLLNASVPEQAREPLAAQILATFNEDVVDTLAGIRGHFGDPWTRVSQSMGAGSADLEDEVDSEQAAGQLAELVLKPEHIWPEIRAFMYAWRGSIEETGISGRLKDNAYGPQRFTEFFAQKVAPSVWLPEEPAAPEPPPPTPRRKFEPHSPDDVRNMLKSDDWMKMSSDELLQLLQTAMLVYGMEVNEADIPLVARLYRHAMRTTNNEHRALMARELTQLVEKYKVHPPAFLPILVVDDDFQVVTTATIDFVSCSPYGATGELYALTELGPLFRDRTLANPGAVFGALVCMGESRFAPFLDKVREVLTTDQVAIAARVHTQFLQHHDVQYWLSWAKELASQSGDVALANFGSCASAIALAKRHEKMGKVFESERDFPCTGKERPVRHLREWTIDEYADVLAPELYRLEAEEAAPRVMAHVLRVWGYEPAAPLVEQFIPPAGPDDEKPVRLKRLAGLDR